MDIIDIGLWPKLAKCPGYVVIFCGIFLKINKQIQKKIICILKTIYNNGTSRPNLSFLASFL